MDKYLVPDDLLAIKNVVSFYTSEYDGKFIYFIHSISRYDYDPYDRLLSYIYKNKIDPTDILGRIKDIEIIFSAVMVDSQSYLVKLISDKYNLIDIVKIFGRNIEGDSSEVECMIPEGKLYSMIQSIRMIIEKSSK